MSSKNWGDKADKDLFFTILSVKNIGVISGSEWTTIGNHMRSLGYGFTNEGCRQHFQGLRRAQQKAEANGASSENPRKIDPTLNPITRRPGPGRGRPRKSTGGGPDSESASPGQVQAQMETGVQLQDQQQQSQPEQLQQQASMQPQPPMDPNVGPAPTPMMDAAPPQVEDSPPPQPMVMQTEGVSFEDASEESDEHAAKRPKLEENHDPALNDEAILSALAAHTQPGTVEHYNPDFYGEA